MSVIPPSQAPGQALRGLAWAVLLPCALLVGCARTQPPAKLSIASSAPPKILMTDDRAAIEVVDLDHETFARVAALEKHHDEFFGVYSNIERRDQIHADTQPIAGKVSVDPRRRALRFEPQFPFQSGIPYFVLLSINGMVATPEFTGIVRIPKPQTAPTVVEQVYPTAVVLPENQLKFYIHFSAPMSRGEAYDHIKLLDSNGKVIESVFLELGEELWDPSGKRFTLLFDPGRIKHGLKPREDLGPTLENGKTYSLVIDPRWPDANGNPLKQPYRKAIKAGPPLDKAVDPQAWKVQAPATSDAPLTVAFPVMMEHALLQRELWVTDAAGQRVAGTIQVSDEEKTWRFTPASPWKPGAYKLVAKTTLEDAAGNKIGQLFEVDVFQKIDRAIKSATVELPFTVPAS